MRWLIEQEFVSLHSQLELDMLWNTQPVEADKSVGDMVTEFEMIYQTSGCIEHGLKTALQIDRETSHTALP